MNRIKNIKEYISKMQRVSSFGAQLLEDYYPLYNEFMESIPEYQAAFQEAVIYADQLRLIPTSVKPYVLYG